MLKGRRNAAARLVMDAAGPGLPAKGRDARERTCSGAQTAALAAIALIREHWHGDGPVILRAAADQTACMAGMDITSKSELGSRVRLAWRTTATERQIYLAGWRPGDHAYASWSGGEIALSVSPTSASAQAGPPSHRDGPPRRHSPRCAALSGPDGTPSRTWPAELPGILLRPIILSPTSSPGQLPRPVQRRPCP